MATTESTCFDCGFQGHCHQHHVIPRSKGGKNTVPLCEPCHGKVHDHSFLNHTKLIKDGLAAALKKGVKLGRRVGSTRPPREVIKDHPDIVTQLRLGNTIRKAAAVTGKSSSTVFKVKLLLAEEARKAPSLYGEAPKMAVELPVRAQAAVYSNITPLFPAFERLGT